jgi:carboxyl-terminal processing protease
MDQGDNMHDEHGPDRRRSLNPFQRIGRPRLLRPHARSMVMSVLLIMAMMVGAGLDRVAIQQGIVGADGVFTDIPEFKSLEDTYDLIRENYVESDEISDEQLLYGATKGMVDSLGDTGHSTFMTPEEAEKFTQQQNGILVGIGVQLDYTGNIVTVVAPIDNSPAFEAGIRSGDVILEVDGTVIADFWKGEESIQPQVSELLSGEAGTDVTLKLIHAGETEPYEVTITRAKIELDPVSWRMLPNNVMWLRLSQFSSGATEGVKKALRDGKAAGAEAVILDLRNNPGGLVFEAIGINSQFMPNGTTMYKQEDKDGDMKPVKTIGNDGEWLEGPLVVLINGNSASAAEITSSALQASGRAQLYGETTYGTGTVLLPFTLDDGSIAMLGTDLWLTADDKQIWKKGVDPDVEVSLEPGVQVDIPILYSDQDITEDEYSQVEDNQLTAGYDAIRKAMQDDQA